MTNILKSFAALTMLDAALVLIGATVAAFVLAAILGLGYASAVGISIAGLVLGALVMTIARGVA